MPNDYRVLGSTLAVVAGITYNLLPFTILPLYVSLERIDRRLVEAAKDLYADRTEAFRKVVFPLSLPGVFAAMLLTSIPAVGDYVNADVLGGRPGTAMIGNIIQQEFLTARDYPEAASLAFILMAILLVGAIVYARLLGTEEVTTVSATRVEQLAREVRVRREPRKRWTRFILPSYSALFLLYLAFPILVIVLFSFNDSDVGFGTAPRVKTTWFGFTTAWYGRVFEIPDLTEALQNSLLIAFTSSLAAAGLGALIGLALGRYRYRGKSTTDFVVFLGISSPEVVLGAALALYFVTLGVARGLTTLFCLARDVQHPVRGRDGTREGGGTRSLSRGRGDGSRRRPIGDVLQGHAAADLPRHPRRVAARLRAVDGRLRDQQLRAGSRHHVPDLGVRRDEGRHPAARLRVRDVHLPGWSDPRRHLCADATPRGQDDDLTGLDDL